MTRGDIQRELKKKGEKEKVREELWSIREKKRKRTD